MGNCVGGSNPPVSASDENATLAVALFIGRTGFERRRHEPSRGREHLAFSSEVRKCVVIRDRILPSPPKSMEKFAEQLVLAAGKEALRLFGKARIQYAKSLHPSDAVTKADVACEKIITKRIKKRYPHHGIIAEESGAYQADADFLWYIDPIDGTLNYGRGVPVWGIMAALVHKGVPLLCAIYLPITRELFTARKGKGAYLNGKRIHRSSRRNWAQSIGTVSSSVTAGNIEFVPQFLKAAGKKHVALTAYGSIAANAGYVASGRTDWGASWAGQLHDFIPASILLKEAGCKVTDVRGNNWKPGGRGFVAANPILHKKLLKLTRIADRKVK